jgi:hypothetical protein
MDKVQKTISSQCIFIVYYYYLTKYKNAYLRKARFEVVTAQTMKATVFWGMITV